LDQLQLVGLWTQFHSKEVHGLALRCFPKALFVFGVDTGAEHNSPWNKELII
jgi:hypothetical protein